MAAILHVACSLMVGNLALELQQSYAHDQNRAGFSDVQGKKFSLIDAASYLAGPEQPQEPEWYHVTSAAQEGRLVPPWPPMYDSWISTNHEEVVFFLGGGGGGPGKPVWNATGSIPKVGTPL
jgi:hypothetical protein